MTSAIQGSFPFVESPRCGYPGGCDRAARRTLDTGVGVVAACAAHQQTQWWASCARAADRALREARAAWTIEPDREREPEGDK